MKTYVCRKIYMYNFLTARGFEPFAVQPDKYDCHRLIWLYEDTDKLRDAIEEYYNQPWFKKHAI